MKINYKIKEVKPHIFAVIVKDSYDRAMLFCRAQEYYESPNKKFRGKDFSIWDYMKWYSTEQSHGFSYGVDWSGFNIPFEVMWECYNKCEMETPYDEVMWEILTEIDRRTNSNKKCYVIGAGDTNGWTFQHEICHGLWSTNPDYKKIAKKLLSTIKPEHFLTLKNNLLEMGYTEKVIEDEIQAYIMYGWDSDNFGNGVSLESREMYNTWFSEELEKFSK